MCGDGEPRRPGHLPPQVPGQRERHRTSWSSSPTMEAKPTFSMLSQLVTVARETGRCRLSSRRLF